VKITLIDAVSLKEYLRNKEDEIVKVLEHIGIDTESIKYHPTQNYLSMCRIGGDNKNGLLLWLDSLSYKMMTRNNSGNLFTLVMDETDCNFPTALKRIARWSGYDGDSNIKIELPFGGFYKQVRKDAEGNYIPTFTYYPESALPPADCLSQKYFKDGVDFQTQELFGVRLDLENNSIATPIYDYSGQLVGCKNRSNDPFCPKDERFYASLPYPKTSIVYGYAINYHSIVSKNTIVVLEAEKSVQQMYSFGCPIATAIGGHCISSTQAHYIKSFGAKNIVLAYDEGIDEDSMRYDAEKLIVDNHIMKNNVYYIYDKNGYYLNHGSKDSPSDHGRYLFEQMYKNCLVKIT